MTSADRRCGGRPSGRLACGALPAVLAFLALLPGRGGMLLADTPVPATSGDAINSPFLGARGDGPAPLAAELPLELRGIMTVGQGTWFSIYESATKSATWLRLNESGANFVVQGYRAASGGDQVVVFYRGATYTLALKKGKTTQAAAAKAGAEGKAAGVGDSGAPDTLAGVPMSDLRPDELGRLQLLISQVRTRIGREKQAAKLGALKESPPNPTPPSPATPDKSEHTATTTSPEK